MSNNSFDVSNVPPWFSALQSLTTLYVILLPHCPVPRVSMIFFLSPMSICAATHASEYGDAWILNYLNGLILCVRMMESTQIQGELPVALFSLPSLETVWVLASAISHVQFPKVSFVNVIVFCFCFLFFSLKLCLICLVWRLVRLFNWL